MSIEIWLVIVLSIFLAGYAIGRRRGIKEGREEGIISAPLIIKEKYFTEGKCPICSKNIDI